MAVAWPPGGHWKANRSPISPPQLAGVENQSVPHTSTTGPPVGTNVAVAAGVAGVVGAMVAEGAAVAVDALVGPGVGVVAGVTLAHAAMTTAVAARVIDRSMPASPGAAVGAPMLHVVHKDLVFLLHGGVVFAQRRTRHDAPREGMHANASE